MLAKVQFHNNVYDMISDITLHCRLDTGKIKKFYRRSEKRWFSFGAAISEKVEISAPHSGAERHITPKMICQTVL